MTEAEWLACDFTDPMLVFIQEEASQRKLRLFACACCRRIWQLLTDEQSQKTIEIAERFADGEATIELLRTAHAAVENASRIAWQNVQTVKLPNEAAYQVTKQDYLAFDMPALAEVVSTEQFDDVSASDSMDSIAGVIMHSAISAQLWGTAAGDTAAENAFDAEAPKQAHLFRCVFGNPFRPITLNPAWLAWNDDTVRRIAQAIYDDHAFDRMPILADALEDAGCDNTDMLNHCRQPGVHVRGCWVVDLLLGKA
jgi:hypothetical protein